MKNKFLYIVFIITLLLLLFWNINYIPSTSALWDEGWTMLVAKNWVEIGHYGQLLDGKPAGPGLSASFPVVLPVAASFKLLGVGVWQGRLPIALMTLGLLTCMFLVGCQLGGYKVGMGTVLVTIFMSPHPLANPIYMGRQVMAEIPMLFFFLAGFVCFLKVPKWFGWMAGVVVFWGLALKMKGQMPPFFSIALLIPLGLAMCKRQWRLASYFSIGLAGSWLFSVGLTWIWTILIQGHTITAQPLEGLVQPLALTLAIVSRRSSILTILLIGIPTVVSLLYITLKFYRKSWLQRDEFKQLIWLSLITFCGSWLCWYLILSIGWVRYVMPATVVGSILVAQMISDLTLKFDLRYSIKQIGNTLIRRRIISHEAGLFWMFVVALPMIFLTIKFIYLPITGQTNLVVYEVVDNIHKITRPSSLVECYETEVLFLLNRPYHYPPDQVSVDVVNQWTEVNKSYIYDPIPFNPDLLVLGPYAHANGLYDNAIQSGTFMFISKIGVYEIYQYVR